MKLTSNAILSLFVTFFLFCVNYSEALIHLPNAKPLLLVASRKGVFRKDFPTDFKHSEASGFKKYTPRTQDDFQTRDSRLGFIRKVFAIFGAQMATTMAVTYVIMTNSGVSAYVKSNKQALSLGSLLLSTAIIGALGASESLRYRPPWNLALLGLHTILQSVVVGVFSSLMSARSVFMGAAHTLAAVAAIALYTFQPNPKYDFTALGGVLLTALTTLLVGSILGMFFDIPLSHNVQAGSLAVIFATYLLHDMQKVVGGTHHKHQYGEKEYILAALDLYQDAIGLFKQVVKLLNEQEKRKKKKEDEEQE